MSIRTLTDRLHEEFLEVGRNRQFDAMRSRAFTTQPENTALPSSASRLGDHAEESPKRTQISVPRENASLPRVGLRTRSQENPWGIPGGIASRFGRDALAQRRAEEARPPEQQIPDETEQEVNESPTQAETALDTAETDRPTEDASERETEKDEAARITIELQSH